MPNPVEPQTSELYEVPIPERIKAVAVPAGTRPTFRFPFIQPNGATLDLTPYAVNGTVSAKLRFQEATGQGGRYEATGTVPTPANGQVLVAPDLGMAGGPGIFRGQVGIIDANGFPAEIDTFFVAVERSLWASTGSDSGPPTLDEVRLSLRDSSSVENRLLDNVQFDDAEICQAIVRTVEAWNASLPPIDPYSTQTFPFREVWMRGIRLCLFRMVAEWYRKNRLTYQAGGRQVNDLDKAQEYDAIADGLQREWDREVKQRKASINASQAWGGVASPYGRGGRGRW